ncbi:MAG: DUF1015 family protein [Actinomycetota bacterium]
MDAGQPREATGRPGSPTTLELRPFRGVRYDTGRLPDPAAVTSPPYDVIAPENAAELAAAHPHNVVRLILPGADGDPVQPGAAHQQAAGLLRSWLAGGVLRRDATPGLYVYEQRGPGLLQRGLIGAVGLHPPADRVVLPHEDVVAHVVADRLALLRATRANLEPILLLYDGGGAASDAVETVAESRPPLLTAATPDGLTHRLWQVTDRELLTRVAADLAPRQALIADGHHRYATYLAYQEEQRAAGRGAGPWDFGLALLVDTVRHPPRLQGIHRSVSGLGLAEALTALRDTFQVTAFPAGAPARPPDLNGRRGAAADSTVFVLTDGDRTVRVDLADPTVLRRLPVPAGAGRAPDAQVLTDLVLPRLWGVPDEDPRVHYEHDPEQAVRHARAAGGVAVLVRAPSVDEVRRVAAAGQRMPRKSTSFGPKPRTGLVLRVLPDEATPG